MTLSSQGCIPDLGDNSGFAHHTYGRHDILAGRIVQIVCVRIVNVTSGFNARSSRLEFSCFSLEVTL